MLYGSLLLSSRILPRSSFLLRYPPSCYSIYLVHDEVKDKQFELELSWVCAESEGKHQFVPKDLKVQAEKYAKAALEEESSDDEEEDM